MLFLPLTAEGVSLLRTSPPVPIPIPPGAGTRHFVYLMAGLPSPAVAGLQTYVPL